MIERLEPACIEGVDILRALSFGVPLHLIDRRWRFVIPAVPSGWREFDRFRLVPEEVADYDFEWLLEDGLARRFDGGRKATITESGKEFLRSLDLYCRAVPMPVNIPETVAKIIAEIRTRHPEFDHAGRSYTASMHVAAMFLGLEWMQRHVMGTTAPTDFFKNDWATPARINMHRVRVIHLAETLANLHYVGGFNKVVRMLRGGDIEGSFAELEVGKLLALNKHQFRFVVPKKIKGQDFDLEIKFGDLVACADTKCKIESTERSNDTVLGSLKKAHDQFPPDRPSVVFVKLPQTWNTAGTDDSYIQMFERVADQFFNGTGAWRGTRRVVSAVFYFSLALDFSGDTAPIYLARQIDNPNHRFDKTTKWDIFTQEIWETPSHWLDLIKMTA